MLFFLLVAVCLLATSCPLKQMRTKKKILQNKSGNHWSFLQHLNHCLPQCGSLCFVWWHRSILGYLRGLVVPEPGVSAGVAGVCVSCQHVPSQRQCQLRLIRLHISVCKYVSAAGTPADLTLQMPFLRGKAAVSRHRADLLLFFTCLTSSRWQGLALLCVWQCVRLMSAALAICSRERSIRWKPRRLNWVIADGAHSEPLLLISFASCFSLWDSLPHFVSVSSC